MEWRLRFVWELADVRMTARGRTMIYHDMGRYTGYVQLHVTGLGWQPARQYIPDRAVAEARCVELNEGKR
jgi:6-phosphofructokinase